uniref:Sugar phosphate transporter domain-containing protein n=1 Tax=Chlamydomonas euryale TaxID=1486919 RepID=A0A7R9W0I2_9CHLO
MGATDGSKEHSLLATASIVFAWYTSNIVLLLLNKFLLSHTSFRQPVTLTLCHMAACVLLGGLASVTGLMRLHHPRSGAQAGKIAALSVLFTATIVLGNASMHYLPVSFTQAIGATTPFFTAVLAFVVQGSRESLLTYATLVPIVAGIAIATHGEPLFHMLGFILAASATAGRAMKTVLQAILMADPDDKLDPLSLLFYMGLCCIVILVPLSIASEPNAAWIMIDMGSKDNFFYWWLLINSCMSYLVNLTNFLVIKYTSPLTMQVLGNAKGVVAAIVSVFVFHNPVTVSGVLGYAMTVFGVVLYSASKRSSPKRVQSSQDEEVAAQPFRGHTPSSKA